MVALAGCSDSKSSGAGGSSASSAGAFALTDIGSGLQGPSGLHASVFATGLTHASAMAFDPTGRLWVATADYTDTGQDTVSVVNAARTAPVTVLRGQHTPLGLLWNGDTLYVSSNERVDAYTGFDGNAFASQRTVVTFPSGVGELNGLAMAPDSRIVLGISAPCDHCVPSSPFSGSVVSFLPDGSDLRVDASAIRAPIGLAYFPGTAHLYVSMNQRDDLGDQTPGDWLSIVQQGQSWGFPDCYGQGGSACAGKPGPVAVLDPHAAVSGVAIVTGQLGTATGTSALVAEWSTGKVRRVGLAPDGASATQSTPDTFLTGIQNPFGLVIGPDQALYAGDWATGTVYRMGE